MRLRAAGVLAVVVGLVAAGCTKADQFPDTSRTPGPSASSLTYEEAYHRVPINGVGDLKIIWDVPEETEVIAAARRSLAYQYWMSAATDWTSVVPVGRVLSTEKWYQATLADFEGTSSVTGDPTTGPIWVKLMGVEELGLNRTRVTFCTDLGWWHDAGGSSIQVRKNRANVESAIMQRAGEGEGRWLVDQYWDTDPDRKVTFGKQCAKWAQHKP